MPGACRSRRLFASLLGAVGVLLWATETTLITYTTAIPPIQTVALAFGFAALLSPVVWWLTGDDPRDALRHPPAVWLLMVGALVGYHACIYYATQKAPPAPAALLQGTTPLMIVIGSALMPGERLQWWHALGAGLGFYGVTTLIESGGAQAPGGEAVFHLGLIGGAAALWGLYSIAARRLPDVRSSALGAFYVAAALVSFALHLGLEDWTPPTAGEWAAIAGLGILPMGLAIYFWDYGIKHGDIQALGAFAYVEPFVGAVLVAMFTSGALGLDLMWSGALVIGGAAIASADLWRPRRTEDQPPAVEAAIAAE